MATSNPRITVTLKPEQYEFLKAFAETQKASMASVLVELYEMAEPVLIRVQKLIVEAQQAKESVKDGIMEATEEAMRTIEPQAQQAMMNFELFEEAIRQSLSEAREGGGGEAGARSATAPRGTPQPPRNNMGVRSRKSKVAKGKSGKGVL